MIITPHVCIFTYTYMYVNIYIHIYESALYEYFDLSINAYMNIRYKETFFISMI